MATKDYILLTGSKGGNIIVPEEEVYMGSKDEFECMWVKAEDFKTKVFTDYDEAIDFYDDFVFFSYSDTKVKPEEGQYICVYHEKGESLGEDPYYWDYECNCHKWWDGRQWNEFCAQYTEELKLVDIITIEKPNFNYGRAIHYYILKKENGEYIVGYENDGYSHPIQEEGRFASEKEARDYVRTVNP